jgi:hypothetical protein
MAALDVKDIAGHLRQVIEARVKEKWRNNSGVLHTPIQFPNASCLVGVRESENEMLTEPPTKFPWLKLDIRMDDAQPFTRGGASLNQLDGLIYLNVFVPQGTGTGELYRLLGLARAIFDLYHGGLDSPTNHLRCKASSGGGAPEPDKTWVYCTVRTPFYSFEKVIDPVL